MFYPHPEKEWVTKLSDIKAITLRTNETGWLWISYGNYDIAVELLWAGGGYAYGAYLCEKGKENFVHYLEGGKICSLRSEIKAYIENS